MRRLRNAIAGVVLAAMVGVSVGRAEAQPTGTWQLAPLCNSLTLSLIGDASPATVSGFLDTCGGPTLLAAFGSAFFAPDGSISVGLTVVYPGGSSTSLYLVLNPATLHGTWSNAVGLTGSLIPPQPAPAPEPEPEPGSPPEE
jgi:hypothetical protein